MKRLTPALLLCLALMPASIFGQSTQNQVQVAMQSGHTLPVRKFVISTDGKFLFSTDYKNVVMWVMSTRKQYASFTPSSGGTFSDIAISRDGKLLAMGSESEIQLYDIANDKLLPAIKSPAIGLAFHPGKNILASLSPKTEMSTPQLTLQDYTTKQVIKKISIDHYESGSSAHVVFSPDGGKVILASGTKYVVADVATGKVLKAAWANNNIRGVLTSAASNKFAILSFMVGQGTVEVYDVNSFEAAYTRAVEDAAEAFAMSPDQRQFITAGIGHATVFDFATGNIVKEAELTHHCTAVTYTTDGKQIVLARKQDEGVNTIGALDFMDTDFNVKHAVTTDVSMVEYVAMNPTLPQMALADWNGNVKVFDLSSGMLKKRKLGEGKLETRPGELVYSPDGKYLAVGSHWQHMFEAWNTSTWAVASKFTGVSYAPDIKSKYVSFVYMDSKMYVMANGEAGSYGAWEFSNGKMWSAQKMPYAMFGRYGHPRTSHYFDVTGWGVTVRIFPNEKEAASFAAKNPVDFGLSADGRFAAVTNSEGIHIIDALQFTKLKLIEGKGFQTVAFSNDGKYLAVSRGAIIELFETGALGSVGKLTGHNGDINSMSFSNDNRLLLTGSDDGSSKLWDFKSGKEIVSIIGIGTDDYLMITPDNYYLSSKGAFKGAMFRNKGRLLPLDQFDLKFNRPDIVLSRIGFAPPESINSYYLAYKKRLKKLGYTEEMLSVDFNLPEVQVQQLPSSSEAKTITVNIQAKDKLYKLNTLKIYVNGCPLPDSKGIDLKAVMSTSYSGSHRVELEKGRNVIEVEVTNEKGITSLKQTLEIAYTGEEQAPETWFLAIGVSSFQQADYNLTYAAKDATDLVNLVKNRGSSLGTKHTMMLTDADVTRENVLKAKEWLLQSKVQDKVIVFIATHGLLDENMDYYLATTDVDFGVPATRGLLYEAFEGIIDGIPAREKLVLIDACHSGEIDKEENEVTTASATTNTNVKARGFKTITRKTGVGLDNSFELMKTLFADFKRGTGAVVVSAASGKEFAYEAGAQKNGIFTYAILEGLISGKANINHDSEVKVSELREYVGRRVEQLTEGKQHPTSRSDNLEFDFRVW